MRHRLRASVSWLAIPVVVIVVLELASHLGWVSPLVLPAPSRIAGAIWALLGQPFFWRHFRVTMTAALLGLLIGGTLGVVLGAVSFGSEKARALIHPYVVGVEALPKIIVAPILLIWFGYGIGSKLALVILVVFFPLYLNTLGGLAEASRTERDLLRTYGASGWTEFRLLLVHRASRNMFVGFRQAVILSFLGAIVAEFVGSTAGLGVLVNIYTSQLRTDYVIAVTLIIAWIGLALFLSMDRLEYRIAFWHGAHRAAN